MQDVQSRRIGTMHAEVLLASPSVSVKDPLKLYPLQWWWCQSMMERCTYMPRSQGAEHGEAIYSPDHKINVINQERAYKGFNSEICRLVEGACIHAMYLILWLQSQIRFPPPIHL